MCLENVLWRLDARRELGHGCKYSELMQLLSKFRLARHTVEACIDCENDSRTPLDSKTSSKLQVWLIVNEMMSGQLFEFEVSSLHRCGSLKTAGPAACIRCSGTLKRDAFYTD